MSTAVMTPTPCKVAGLLESFSLSLLDLGLHIHASLHLLTYLHRITSVFGDLPSFLSFQRMICLPLHCCTASDAEARHTHTALKETLFRRQRLEELPASFELGVHIQGRRKNRCSEARKLPPGARPATAAAVGVSAPSLDGDCASACSVRHLRRRRP